MSDSDLPGTGVDPTKVINRTKRLKAAWRNSGTKLSLKAWASNELDAGNQPNAGHVEQWFDNKSYSRTAEARKEHRSRVRTGRALASKDRPSGGKRGKGKGK